MRAAEAGVVGAVGDRGGTRPGGGGDTGRGPPAPGGRGGVDGDAAGADASEEVVPAGDDAPAASEVSPPAVLTSPGDAGCATVALVGGGDNAARRRAAFAECGGDSTSPPWDWQGRKHSNTRAPQ